MKFQTTSAFDRDFKHLPAEHQQQFRAVASGAFHAAAERAAAGGDRPWPNCLRVKPVEGTRGIWEMTWSKSNPDGRATWQWVKFDGLSAILWRRVGDHAVLKTP